MSSSSMRFNYGYLPITADAKKALKPDEDVASSGCATEATRKHMPATGVQTSIFERSAVGAPADPILSMRDRFLEDSAKDKLNLAVGVYRTAEGKPYVLKCVKEAESAMLIEQMTGKTDKEYLPADGMMPFCESSIKLLLGDTVTAALAEKRVVAAQSLSGLGGLHLAARMIGELLPGATVHLPTPTWPIHPDIFNNVGVRTTYYPYYDAQTCGFDFAGMRASLQAMAPGSIVLLHACAHNPTGVDPSHEQWEEIGRLVAEKGLIPLIDSAYQGFASGDLEADAHGVRLLASIPGVEMFICQSYAKNMGLYGERVGCFSILTNDSNVASKMQEQLKRAIRLTYSSPPRHGAAIAQLVLSDPTRREMWRQEVAEMAGRLQEMRVALSEALAKVGCPPPHGTALTSWSHVLSQRGMFTYTGLTSRQVDALRERFHIYMPQDGRISMASLTSSSCVILAAAIKEVLLSKLEQEDDDEVDEDEDDDEVKVGEEAAGPPPKKQRA